MRKENGSATEKVEYCGERKERGQVQDYRASVIESRKLLEMWRPEKTGWMKGKDKTSVISFTLAGTPHTIKAKQTCSECREAAFGIFQQKHGLGLREHLLSQTAAVARGMPRSAFSLSSSLLSLCLALYYQDTVALLPYSTVSHFEMPPNPLVTMRVTATTKKKKKKSFNIHLSGRWFFPLRCEWVEAFPGRALEADTWEGSQRNIWALRWMEALNVESLSLHCASFSRGYLAC